MSTPTLHEHHIVQPKIYLLILIALLVLTATTTGVAFLDLGIFNPIVALGDRLHQGDPGRSLLHASPLQLQIAEADRLLRPLHLSGAHHHDADRLHKPCLGSLVGKSFSMAKYLITGVAGFIGLVPGAGLS